MKINKKLFAYAAFIILLASIICVFSSCGECEHEWSDWSVSAPATCSVQGEEQRQCLNCKQTQAKMTDVSEHKYDMENIVWSWDGYKSANAVISCINNASHSRVINANITEEITKTPTCNSSGTTVYTATISVNNITYTATKSEEISATGHTEIPDVAVPATCNKVGLTQGSHCSVCNEVLVAQEKIPMIDHTESTIEAVEPTCTKEGSSEGKKCSVCEGILVAPQTIAKLSHKELVIEGKAPTCLKTGLTQGKICSVCQEVLVPQTIISKIDCSYESVVTSPTCDAQGYTTFTCTTCGDSYINGYVNADVHIFGEWEESDDVLLRRCTYGCGKAQRILYITATYNGACLLTGESVWEGDVTVTATLSDNTVINLDSFTLENSEMTVDGANYVTVKYKSQSTVLAIPAIYSNFEGTTPQTEFTYTKKNDAITITGFVGTSTDIVIPAHIERVPVRYISSSAFKGQAKITSVVIPDSILSISSNVFYNCRNLKNVTFGNSLTEIGYGAFYNCVSLTQVDIPINVITIDGVWNCTGAFEGCTGLKSVTIGGATDNVALTTIGERTFQKCTSLTSVSIGDSVKSIGNEAFSECSSLHTVTLGENVEEIGHSAFYECQMLSSIVIPNSVKVVSYNAFYECQNLKSVSFGTGVTEIGHSAFYNCVSLTQVDIPMNVITIDGVWNCTGTFEGCTGLKSVTIGGATDNVALTTIGERAFKGCTSLTSVTVGNSVKSIGNEAFSECPSLRTVILGENVEEIGHSAFYECQMLSSIVIPNSVKVVSYNAFYECRNLRSVSFGTGVTEIGHSAFYNCVSLTQVDIPINVITIDGVWNWTGAFEGCTGLKSVTIGGATDSVALTTIGERAFKGCTSLTSVTVGNSVKSIGNEAFSECSSLHTVTLGENVEEIGHSAFYECQMLSSIVIPNSVKVVSYNAFYECRNLRSVSFGTGVVEIGHSAFYNCVSLTQVDIPINVITIDGVWNWTGAFEGCTGLKSVTIGGATDNVALTTIGERAFRECTSLTSVTVGNSVKEIANTAFEGCTALQEITFGSGLESIGTDVFADCYSLESITIPSNIRNIGDRLFKNCTSLVEVVIEKGQGQNRSFGYNVFEGCTNLKRLYYTGSPEDWALITIDETNSFPLDDTPYFYSASKPSASGDYWYYNDSGEKRVWNVSKLAFEAEFSSQVFVEIFGGESSSYSTTFFNSLENYSDFQEGLNAWEALHVIADTSFNEGVWQVSKKDLYKLVIFDLLCGEANAQETLVSGLEHSALVYLDDMAKDIFGKDVTSDFLKSVSPKLEYNAKLLGYGIIGLQYILESHSNMYDALMSCATYLVLADMDECFQTVLLQIANDSLNPQELRDAASEYAEIYKMSCTEILARFATEYSTSNARAAFTTFTDILWDKTVEVFFPAFGVAQSLAKGVLFLADLNMNLDAIYMAYYKLDVAVHLEASLRNIISNPTKDYLKASHYAEAEAYVYAIDMYKTSVLLGFDYSSRFLQEYSKNKTEAEKEECTAMISSLSSMKQSKKQLFTRFDDLVSQAYTAYYS